VGGPAAAYRETEPVETEPGGRRAAEDAVVLARREVGQTNVVGVVERLEARESPVIGRWLPSMQRSGPKRSISVNGVADLLRARAP